MQKRNAAKQYIVNHEQCLARAAVHKAVKNGKLTKQPCPCGSLLVQAHHHLGYARENFLNVQWLCFPCHRAHHDAERKTA